MRGFLAAAAAMFAAMYSTQAILPEIGRDLDVSPARAGLTVSALVLAIIPGAWIWGPLSDRIGRRRTLVLASALLVPASLLVSVAPDFPTLVALRALQGLIMPGLLTVGVPYVTAVFVPRFGAAVMGWYMSSLILGGLVGRVGVAAASVALGWRPALALIALLPLGATLAMRRGLPEAPPAPRGAVVGGGRRFADPHLLGALATGPALFFAFVAAFTFVRFRLESGPFDLSPLGSATVFGLWVLGGLAPVAGRIVERRGWRWTAGLGLALAVAGVVVTLPDRLPAVVIGLALLVAGMFIGSVASQVALGRVRCTTPGQASATYYSLYYVAGALAAFLPGLAWQAGGWPALAATAGGVLALASAALAALAARARSAPAPVRAAAVARASAA